MTFLTKLIILSIFLPYSSKEVLNAANGMLAIASKAVSVSINDMVSMDLSKFSTMKDLSKVKNYRSTRRSS